jgi:hypothetical protein
MQTKEEIREYLFEQLQANNALWSYDKSTMTAHNLPDDFIIEKVLMYLDLDEINMLFLLFPKKQIKEVWKWNMCPLGDYYHSSNVLFAIIYFKIKNPQRYVVMQARRAVRKNLTGNYHAGSITKNG